jgi:hypothetical protein
MKSPWSVPESTEVQSEVISKIVKANLLLANHARRLGMDLSVLRNTIFNNQQVDLPEQDVAIIKENQNDIHVFLKNHYGGLETITRSKRMDFGATYLEAYDVLWYYTNLSVPVFSFMYTSVKRRVCGPALKDSPIRIKSSLIAQAIRNFHKIKNVLDNELGRRATLDEVFAKLGWNNRKIKKFLLLPLNRVMMGEVGHKSIKLVEPQADVDYEVLNQLKPAEQDIIKSLLQKKSVIDISVQRGCTPRYVRMVLKQAKSKLQSLHQRVA